MRTIFTRISCGFMLALLMAAQTAVAEDWPRWRGVRGDGTWSGPNLPEQWPADGLRTVWRADIGGGYAGVVVSKGRVYIMDLLKGNPERERVLCLDADTGKMVWARAYPVNYGKMDYDNGPRAAPTVVDGLVYTLGAVGHVYCIDAVSGRVLWTKDMVGQYNAQIPTWGLAASPVVDGNLVIIHAGAQPNGCLMAFDRLTGTEVWRSVSDPAGYATPIIVDHPVRRQVVVWTPENIRGVDLNTGKPLWHVPYKINMGVSMATPIYEENTVFITAYWEGSKAITLGKNPGEITLAWEENKFLRGLMSQPLYRNGYAYSLDKRYGLTCFELKTGKKRWDAGNRMTPKGRNPQATMVWLGHGDRVLVLNSDGELIQAHFNPDGYRESSRAKIIGPTWAHPAYAGTRVYARNDTELVCVSLMGSDQ